MNGAAIMENKAFQLFAPTVLGSIIAGLVAFAAVYFGHGARMDHIEADVARHNVNERDWLKFQGTVQALATKDDIHALRSSIQEVRFLINARHSAQPSAYLKGAQPRRAR